MFEESKVEATATFIKPEGEVDMSNKVLIFIG
jgi:hypothetical protein